LRRAGNFKPGGIPEGVAAYKLGGHCGADDGAGS
jgi:hypothetical protein